MSGMPRINRVRLTEADLHELRAAELDVLDVAFNANDMHPDNLRVELDERVDNLRRLLTRLEPCP